MKLKTVRILLALLPAILWACGGSEKPAKDKSEKPAAEKKHADGEDSHEEASDGEHEHGNVRHELGEQTVGGWTVSAQQADDVMAGGETVFYVTITGGEKVSAVRLWVGDEQATQSTRVMGEPLEDTRYHAHTEIPNPLAPTDQFWTEIEDDKGSTLKAAFNLAAGAVLPAMGPQTGFVVPLNGPNGVMGFAELKLHDDKGDLELWLAQDAAMTQPLDLPLDAVITVAFPDLGKSAELRVRNTDRNEDEEGESNVRDGKTNYFIFPGATGADPGWLMGIFRSTATIQFAADGASVSVAPFTLVPHTHGPGEHTH